jgi:16S rRNA (guanine(966)-N(2))-methyltransferase RsmD
MRVISGCLKGRALVAPKGRGVRPTSDQVKETLFNIIGSRIEQATFLDLFAGTGNVGIEALSRGAERAVFVEKHPAHVQILKRNLAACAIESKSVVYCGDANKIIRVLRKECWQFQVLFLDPPYRQTRMLRDLLSQLTEMACVAKTGLIITEHIHTFEPPSHPGGSFSLTKQRRIGNTTLSFYEVENSFPATKEIIEH